GRLPDGGAGVVDADRRRVDAGGGRDTLLECRCVDDGLEGGAGLPARLERAVELGEGEVPAADERPDAAVVRIDGDEHTLEVRRGRAVRRRRAVAGDRVAVAAVSAGLDPLDLLDQRLLRSPLEGGVETGVNAEPADVRVGSEALPQL